MADHSKPTTTSTYANFVTELDARCDDLALQLDPASVTVTNPPTGAVRWSSASNKWEKWSGAAWADLSAGYAIAITGNAGTATKWATARTLAATGDATGTSGAFDGSGNATLALTLANSGVSANTYGSATVIPVLTFDAKGRCTGATTATPTPAFSNITGKPTTLAGYGITDAAPATSGTGILKGNGTGGTSAATGSDVVTLIGATAVQNATSATQWGGLALPTAGAVPAANGVPRADANGYMYFGYINSNSGNAENPTVSQILVTNGGDGFYRKASVAHASAALGGFNAGQTWTDVTASRAATTLYTNSTGKAIMVNVTVSGTVATGTMQADLEIGGVIVAGTFDVLGSNTHRDTLSGIAPPGATYRLINVSQASITRWVELR